MMDPAKKLPARFYVSALRRKPVRERILELSEADSRIVGKDIQKVEFGSPLGRPHFAPLGDGLSEVRSDSTAKMARVIFCLRDGKMVLLHRFMRKTRETPKAALDLAAKRTGELSR